MKTSKKVLIFISKALIAILAIAFFAWLGASLHEVWMHNDAFTLGREIPAYSWWNFFELLF